MIPLLSVCVKLEAIEKRRDGGRHSVEAIRPGFARICDESPLYEGLYSSFAFVYTVLAKVSTQHAADASPGRFEATFSMLSTGRRCAVWDVVV